MRKADPELRAQREREIIAAAVMCFVENGFHQTSMQDVAAASGLSIGLIYRYFENKDAIITRVAQRDREATIAAVNALPDTGDMVAAWSGWLMAAVAEWSDPATTRLVNEVYAEAARSPALQAAIQKNEAALALAIEEKLARQLQHGAFASRLPCADLALGLLTIFDGAVSRRFASAPETVPALDRVIAWLTTRLLAPG
jgi:TetR/AcrR family transcriptional regulator, repressor for uid operon